jgi:hypothetical protein
LKGRDMALPTEVTEAFARIDTATTAAAVYIGGLRDKIKAGMNPEQTAEVVAGLTKVEAFLTEFGKDVENPVPPQPTEFTRRR